MVNMKIRKALDADWDKIWNFFQKIAVDGETYAFDRNINKEQGKALWLDAPLVTYVYEEKDTILATYYLKTNQAGPGSHVCNCGYMVAEEARGLGLASSMCEHSQEVARRLQYKAMQYNFVASSNEGAIRLWKKFGFAIVGRLPKAFDHPKRGYIDALVMYKWLEKKH
jgi:ribosomal protein S18 acetylase RimI-like enzyme